MGKIKKEVKRGGFGYFLRNLNKKHRLSIRDQEDDAELGYMFVSSWRVALALLGLLLIMTAIAIVVVVYTPVLDTLPGNPGRRSREMLSRSILKLDSMENELKVMMLYGENVKLIMEGKTPLIRTIKGQQAEVEIGKKTVPPSAADSLLRQQLETPDGRYGLVADGVQGSSGGRGIEFIVPVKGEVTTPFKPSSGMNGIEIMFSEPRQEIIASAQGTVVMSLWAPEEGNIMQIQHKNNYITIYKHVSQPLKKVGDHVQAGEAIGYAASEADADGKGFALGRVAFELWSDGQPVDPQKYMVF